MRGPLHDFIPEPPHLLGRGLLASPLVLPVLALFPAGHVGAQAVSPDTGASLKSSRMLREVIPANERDSLPTFVSGGRISSRTDLETVVEGRGELRRGDMVIRADRLEYYQPEDLARARGAVSINRAGDVYEGPALELKV